MLEAVLEAFDSAITHAEEADLYQKTARKVVNVIDSLTASVDALPEELRPTLPTEEEIARLRSITTAVMSPELQGLKAKVDAALTLGPDAGLVDFDEEAAKALVVRYNGLATSMGARRGGNASGGRSSGIRQLNAPIKVTCGDSNPRISGSRTGGGDWTWVRWQMTDHAKDHDYIAKEALDSLRLKIQEADANGGTVDETLVSGDGTEYKVQYPASV